LGVGGTITYEDVARVDATGISTFREGFKVGPLSGIGLTAYKDGSIRTSGIVTAASFVGDGSGLTGTISTTTSAAKAYALDSAANITTGIVTATAFIPSTGQLSNRNLIINGGMKVAQRGTVDQLLYNYAGPDRFKFDGNGGQRSEVSQANLTVDGKGHGAAWRFDNRTANASPSTANYQLLSYRFEGQDLQHIKKGTSDAEALTLQFWIKSPKAGTHIVELVDQDNSARHINKAYTVSSANTWQYITVTFPGDTTGALTNDANRSLDLNFWLMAGATYNSGTLQTSWGSDTNANRAVGQVNCVDNAANNFYLTGVQLEVGSVATPFEHRSYGDELRRCQRYFWQATKQGTTGQVTNKGVCMMNYVSGSDIRGTIDFPVEMRAEPTLSSNDNSNSWYINAGSGADMFDRLDLYSATAKRAIVRNSAHVSGSAGAGGMVAQETGDSSLSFSAEL